MAKSNALTFPPVPDAIIELPKVAAPRSFADFSAIAQLLRATSTFLKQSKDFYKQQRKELEDKLKAMRETEKQRLGDYEELDARLRELAISYHARQEEIERAQKAEELASTRRAIARIKDDDAREEARETALELQGELTGNAALVRTTEGTGLSITGKWEFNEGESAMARFIKFCVASNDFKLLESCVRFDVKAIEAKEELRALKPEVTGLRFIRSFSIAVKSL